MSKKLLKLELTEEMADGASYVITLAFHLLKSSDLSEDPEILPYIKKMNLYLNVLDKGIHEMGWCKDVDCKVVTNIKKDEKK